MNNTNQSLLPVDELLPHTGNALLLNALIAYGDDWVEAEVNHQQSSLYTDSDGRVPSWVGIEYMVQTIGLLAGLEGKRQGNLPKPGFLLGARSFSTNVDFFAAHAIIKIRAEMRFRDENNLVMFACTITDSKNNLLANAEIKAIQPENIDDLLKELIHA